MNKKTLIVLAAGMGSRYGGLKQIDPVGPSGESLLDYSIYDACAAGFGSVVFVIRRDIEQEFREKIGNVGDFLRSPVPAITPVDFLSRFLAGSIQECLRIATQKARPADCQTRYINVLLLFDYQSNGFITFTPVLE